MLTVTPGAGVRLLRRLRRKDVAADMAMRFTRGAAAWKLRLDRIRPSDTVIVHQGRTVLLLDEAVAREMTNMTLGIRKTEAGPRFALAGGHAV